MFYVLVLQGHYFGRAFKVVCNEYIVSMENYSYFQDNTMHIAYNHKHLAFRFFLGWMSFFLGCLVSPWQVGNEGAQ